MSDGCGFFCELSLWLTKTCGRLTGHKWGPLHYDPVLRRTARTCRLCRCTELPAPTIGTAYSNQTHITLRLSDQEQGNDG
jgi:hypothetical protein